MARPIRIEFPGAVYHVMARGNHGQPVFGEDSDRKLFLETLGEACKKTALKQGLEWLGLNASALEQMPKAAPEKAVLAWWLRRDTTVSLHWLAEHLAMGHFTRMSQAVNQVKRRPEREQGQLKRRWSELADN